jgi:hypothetical protein
MNNEEFRDLVQRTREAQRRYFKHRDNLDEAKAMERAVDDALKDGGRTLFDQIPKDSIATDINAILGLAQQKRWQLLIVPNRELGLAASNWLAVLGEAAGRGETPLEAVTALAEQLRREGVIR